jgi:hypothetical protein
MRSVIREIDARVGGEPRSALLGVTGGHTT